MGSSVGEPTGESIVSVAVVSSYDGVVESGTLIDCVLFACTGITKAVPVRVRVDVAEATLAVDVKVVMPVTSPVFASPVAEPISPGTEVVREMFEPVPYPVLPSPAVGVAAPVPEAAQFPGVPEPDVVLGKVLLHVKVLLLDAWSSELVSSGNTVTLTQIVVAGIMLEKEPFCAEGVRVRAGSGPPWIKVMPGTSVENDLRS
jgi:hypothetical protein